MSCWGFQQWQLPKVTHVRMAGTRQSLGSHKWLLVALGSTKQRQKKLSSSGSNSCKLKTSIWTDYTPKTKAECPLKRGHFKRKGKHLPITIFQADSFSFPWIPGLVAKWWITLGISSLSHYLQGFIHPRWLFGISSINSFFRILIWWGRPITYGTHTLYVPSTVPWNHSQQASKDP